MITAPFNFVPLNEKVFFPNWSEQVSHDIPFEDGESGEINITITAKSPIFIRDHEKQEEFCNYNGEYYIPATSVKGMVRNVLEIMSFSKMSFVDDDTYAVRDLRNKKLYMSKMTHDNTFCGWLKKDKDNYIIEDCGKAGRIKHSEIDKIFNIDFASKFRHGKFGNKAKDKTAEKKYKLIGEDKTFEHNFTYVKKDVNREIYRYDKYGTKKGTLVLTGQPSARKEPRGQKPSGKVYEFIFFESKNELRVSKEVFDNFLFAYFDKRTTEPKESHDWSFWKKRLEDKTLSEEDRRVPVFFQKNGRDVLHFGLSYLYKLPYKHSIKDGLPSLHNDKQLDLAQTIFGFIDNNNSLKGRLFFSNFKAIENIKPLSPRKEILGTPRASYYPIYIEQKEGKLYKTYMDSDFSIAGWKRYPIHKNGVKKTEDTGNENVGTTFAPLDSRVVFEGKLRYHNLKKAELGAILSALSFHNTPNTYHNIGMAKPLGYGKIEVKIDGIELEKYLKDFESEITVSIPNWANSEQLTELISMATEQDNSGNSELEYMRLEEFAKNKTGDKDYLRRYTKLDNIKDIKVKSLISDEDIEKLKELQAKKEQEEKLKAELKAQKEKEKKEWDILKESDNISAIEAFIDKYQDSEFLQEAQNRIKAIEEKLQKQKEQEQNREAIEKWKAVLKVDKKYQIKALEDYIKNYPLSPKLEDAKQELEKLTKSKTKTTSKEGLDFSNATDAKSIERVIKHIQNPTDEEKQKLEEILNKIYPIINAKKKKQLQRSKVILRWVGKDYFIKIGE